MLNDYLGVQKEELDWFIDNVEKAIIYHDGQLKHKDINPRTSVSLKIDKFIYEYLIKDIRTLKPATGAFCGLGIKSLLVNHKDKKYMLTTDIKDYFESISFNLLEDITTINKYKNEISKVYFREGRLKRGLIAAPLIAEYIGLKIDNNIKKYIFGNLKLNNIGYSRYYDDIIISSDDLKALRLIEKDLSKTLFGELSLNNIKTKIRPVQGSKILGLVFYNGKIYVPKKYRHKVRAAIWEFQRMPEIDINDLYKKIYHAQSILGSLNYIKFNSELESHNNTKSDIDFIEQEIQRILEEIDKITRSKADT